MKKLMTTTFLSLAFLAAPAAPVLAGTVPSTYDENCNVNWVGGGCGDYPVANPGNDRTGPSVEAVAPTPPAPPPKEDDCPPKETYVR